MSSSLRPSGGSGSNTKRMVHSPHPARFRQLGLDSSNSGSRIPSEYNRTSSKSIEDAEGDNVVGTTMNDAVATSSEASGLHRQSSSMDQEEDGGSIIEEELLGEFVTSPYRVRRQHQQPQQRQQHPTTTSSGEVMAKHTTTTVACPADDAHGHYHVEIVGDNSDDFHDVENHHHEDGRSSSPHDGGANAAVDDGTNSSSLLMVGRVASLLCMSEAIDDWSIITSSSSSSLSNLCVEKNERPCTRMKDVDEEEDLNYFICPDCCEAVQLEASAPRLTGTAGGHDSSVARGDVVGNVERGVAVGTAATTTSPTATAAATTIRMSKHQHQQSKSQSSKESEDNVFPPALTPLTPMTPPPPPPQPSLREVDGKEDHPITTRPTFVHFASSGSGGDDANSSHHPHHNADSPSSLMHTPPLALVGSKSYYDSPISSNLLQSGDYYVDGHHVNNSRNVTTTLKTRGNIRDIQTNQKRYVSRMIATAVLTNPMSLRSYCSQVAVQEATSSSPLKKHNRQCSKHHRHHHPHEQQDRQKVSSKKKLVCSHCHCVFHSSTTTQEDEPPPNYHNGRSMPPQSQDVVVLSSSEATAKKKSAFAKNTNTRSTFHRRFHVSRENVIQQLIGTVVNGVLDHIPQVAISFQIISDTTEYSVTIGVSMCHLASMGMTCFLDAIAYLLWETQNVLVEGFHMLNPWVAVDITTDVLTSGIQSVAEGVGSTKKSASAAIQHYLSRGGEKGGKSKKGHGDVLLETPFGGAGIPSSSGNNGGMNSRSSSRASFLLGIPGVVQVSQALAGGGGGKGATSVQLDSHLSHFHPYDPTNKVLSEKLFKKLNKIDSTSKVIEYRERYEHEALSSRAKQRVQRMMHYAVSLRPFTATVVAPTRETLLHPSHHLLEQQQQDVISSSSGGGRLRRSSSANSKKSSPTSTSGKGGSRKGSSSDEQQQQEGTRMELETTSNTFSNIDFIQASPTGSFASVAVGNAEDDDDNNGEPQPSQRGEQQHHATEAHSTTTPGQASMRAIANRSEVEEATLHSSPDRIVLPGHGSSSSSEEDDDTNMTSGSTPFLCTPKSFPPTPGSRLMVMARGSRFAEDVVFFAREHLRLQDGLESTNDRTRSMALALRDGRRLAVFSADDAGRNISLSCGQHCATKVGNLLYCTTRCMVPVLRNCYVYFEMSVANPVDHQSASIMPSLSIGLSTTEMPNNTLVGAWKSSIGLLTTGQVLAAGQWYSPCDSRISMYGHASTVGCLVLLDDSKSFETWDGMMVPASITFNVDGILVVPPTYLLPPHLGGMIGAGVLSGTLGGPPGTMNTMSMMTGTGTSAGTSTSNTMPPGSYQSGGATTAAAVDDAATAIGSSVPQAATAAGTGATPSATPAIQSPSTTGSFFGLPPTVVPNSSFSLYVPREEDLYATLTLHSPSTQVMCRFCAEDILATTRESIGAPPGTTIYAVDGSVLFEKVENSRT